MGAGSSPSGPGGDRQRRSTAPDPVAPWAHADLRRRCSRSRSRIGAGVFLLDLDLNDRSRSTGGAVERGYRCSRRYRGGGDRRTRGVRPALRATDPYAGAPTLDGGGWAAGMVSRVLRHDLDERRTGSAAHISPRTIPIAAPTTAPNGGRRLGGRSGRGPHRALPDAASGISRDDGPRAQWLADRSGGTVRAVDDAPGRRGGPWIAGRDSGGTPPGSGRRSPRYMRVSISSRPPWRLSRRRRASRAWSRESRGRTTRI